MIEFLPYMMVGGGAVITSTPILFLLFLGLNEILNKVSKNIIQQPRPKDCAPYMKKSYGMPSGHSQVAGFAAAFVWEEATRMQKMILILAAAVTMTQRVMTHCHSVAQVFAGVTVGVVFGLLAFKIVSQIKDKNLRI